MSSRSVICYTAAQVSSTTTPESGLTSSTKDRTFAGGSTGGDLQRLPFWLWGLGVTPPIRSQSFDPCSLVRQKRKATRYWWLFSPFEKTRGTSKETRKRSIYIYMYFAIVRTTHYPAFFSNVYIIVRIHRQHYPMLIHIRFSFQPRDKICNRKLLIDVSTR